MAFELKEEGFHLKDVLVQVNIPGATYHYHMKQLGKEEPDQLLKENIQRIFDEHHETYGYRRVHAQLQVEGYKVNHKKVQRIMRELGLACIKFTRRSRYNSYKGTVGKTAENRVNRRFHTSVRLQKLTTDITEFKCTNHEKLYLSPIMDLYNGEVIAYGVSKKPTLDLVLHPLDQAITIIQQEAEYRTTLHSDQGWHYQHKKWVKTLQKNKVFQSMSRKATCADNAPIENFFGIMKQEMYHGEALVSYDELKRRIDVYIYEYNHKRIKLKLAGLSPVQYRTQTSQVAA